MVRCWLCSNSSTSHRLGKLPAGPGQARPSQRGKQSKVWLQPDLKVQVGACGGGGLASVVAASEPRQLHQAGTVLQSWLGSARQASLPSATSLREVSNRRACGQAVAFWFLRLRLAPYGIAGGRRTAGSSHRARKSERKQAQASERQATFPLATPGLRHCAWIARRRLEGMQKCLQPSDVCEPAGQPASQPANQRASASERPRQSEQASKRILLRHYYKYYHYFCFHILSIKYIILLFGYRRPAKPPPWPNNCASQ